MKTKLISILLACIMLMSLAACSNNNSGDTPDESTKETDVQTTESITTEDTTEPVAELAFNEDLLSDMGLTYSELVEKRGEKVDAVGGEGIHFYFKNGYGAYIWGYEELDYGRELAAGEGYPVPRDENHNIIAEEVQLPKQDVPCWRISQIDVKDFFSNASFPFDISDIEKIEGVEDCRFADEGMYINYYNYCSGFSYNGFRMVIDHNDKEKIDSDAKITVYKPFDSN